MKAQGFWVARNSKQFAAALGQSGLEGSTLASGFAHQNASRLATVDAWGGLAFFSCLVALLGRAYRKSKICTNTVHCYANARSAFHSFVVIAG